MTRKAIDWEAVEIQYRAGIRSLKDIGKEFDVSDAGILKRARRDGWERNLKAKIQARAEARVSAAAVSEEVRARTKIHEQQVVEANALAVADVRLSHRRDITRTRTIAMRLLAELEEQAAGEEVEGQQECAPEARTDALSLQAKVKVLKDLGESLRVLVALERQAYGIGEEVPQPLGHETLTDDELDRAIAKLAKQG